MLESRGLEYYVDRCMKWAIERAVISVREEKETQAQPEWIPRRLNGFLPVFFVLSMYRGKCCVCASECKDEVGYIKHEQEKHLLFEMLRELHLKNIRREYSLLLSS